MNRSTDERWMDALRQFESRTAHLEGYDVQEPVHEIERQKAEPSSQIDTRTLREIGVFRIIDEKDIVRHLYDGDREKWDLGKRAAQRHGFIKDSVCVLGWNKNGSARTIRAVTLTWDGLTAIKQREDYQRLWSGTKSNTVAHDTAVYKVYQHWHDSIVRDNGKVSRVLIESEISGRLAKARKSGWEAEQKAASMMHLKPANGKIVTPDLQIQYESGGNRYVVNLEVSTGSYTQTQVGEKAAAGFSVYAMDSHAGVAVHDGPNIMGEILSL